MTQIQAAFINLRDVAMRATISAIEAYNDMAFILQTNKDIARSLEDRMTKPGGSNTDKQPVSGGSSKTEENWAYCIDQLGTLKAKTAKAQEYMTWFKPAWDRLDEDERIALEERYMARGKGSWVTSAANRLHVERATAYRVSEKALDRLKTLLYGP